MKSKKAERLLTPKKQRKEFRVATQEAVKDKTVLMLSEENRRLAKRGVVWALVAIGLLLALACAIAVAIQEYNRANSCSV